MCKYELRESRVVKKYVEKMFANALCVHEKLMQMLLLKGFAGTRRFIKELRRSTIRLRITANVTSTALSLVTFGRVLVAELSSTRLATSTTVRIPNPRRP